MPRIKNQNGFDAEIEKSLAKIEKYNKLLEEEKAKLEELRNKKRDAELQEFYLFVQERGLSLSEVIQSLRDNLSAEAVD